MKTYDESRAEAELYEEAVKEAARQEKTGYEDTYCEVCESKVRSLCWRYSQDTRPRLAALASSPSLSVWFQCTRGPPCENALLGRAYC